MSNPLEKYYRQPKVYLSLPSKGKYYPNGSIDGEPLNLPVFGMSAMDEIIFKTPDALFTGESVASCIRSCIPGIKDPWSMPQIDLDSALIAIRVATYGQYMDSEYSCKKCKAENTVQLDLSATLDYFSQLKFADTIDMYPLTVIIRPFTYKEQTELSIQQYELRKILLQTVEAEKDKEAKNALLNEFYGKLNKYKAEAFKKQIVEVQADDMRVESKEHINEWINNSDKGFFDKLQKHVEDRNKIWRIQPQKSACTECGEENTVNFNLDNSDFFAIK